jgi:hypothetical protein
MHTEGTIFVGECIGDWFWPARPRISASRNYGKRIAVSTGIFHVECRECAEEARYCVTYSYDNASSSWLRVPKFLCENCVPRLIKYIEP